MRILVPSDNFDLNAELPATLPIGLLFLEHNDLAPRDVILYCSSSYSSNLKAAI